MYKNDMHNNNIILHWESWTFGIMLLYDIDTICYIGDQISTIPFGRLATGQESWKI